PSGPPSRRPASTPGRRGRPRRAAAPRRRPAWSAPSARRHAGRSGCGRRGSTAPRRPAAPGRAAPRARSLALLPLSPGTLGGLQLDRAHARPRPAPGLALDLQRLQRVGRVAAAGELLVGRAVPGDEVVLDVVLHLVVGGEQPAPV